MNNLIKDSIELIWTIAQQLQKRKQSGQYRHRVIHSHNDTRHIVVDGKKYLNFSSNDYLGLSHHPAVIKAWQQGAGKYGVGSGSSGHITGYSHVHSQLEAQLADWLGYARALVYISGFSANQAVISALADKNSVILADRLSHASIIDGALSSPAQFKRFQHNDVQSLQRQLRDAVAEKLLVITEGVFSMDGDMAPLSALFTQTQEHQGLFYVDDAHGIGTMGQQGQGSCQVHQVHPDILLVTFGKAFGVSGAAILCNDELAEYFLQFSRHLIYSTAMPAAQACAISQSLQCIKEGNHLREQLQGNITQFRQKMTSSNLKLLNSTSAIQAVLAQNHQQIITLEQGLRAQGFWVKAILPPTVPLGGERLRITLTAAHCSTDIDQLVEALERESLQFVL